MQIKDTGLGFGVVTIASHWIGAVLMVSFIVLSLSTLVLDGDAKLARQGVTATFGFLCFALFSFRVFWRLKHHYPLPLGGATPIEVIVGRCVGFALLVAGVVLPLILWVLYSAGGVGFRVFGVKFPDIWPAGPDAAFYLSVLFWLGVTAFSFGFLLHLFSALKHQFFLKDDAVLRLMGKRIEL